MAIKDSPEQNENMHYSLTGIQIWEEALTIWVCLLAFYVFQGENEGLFLDVFLSSFLRGQFKNPLSRKLLELRPLIFSMVNIWCYVIL